MKGPALTETFTSPKHQWQTVRQTGKKEKKRCGTHCHGNYMHTCIQSKQMNQVQWLTNALPSAHCGKHASHTIYEKASTGTNFHRFLASFLSADNVPHPSLKLMPDFWVLFSPLPQWLGPLGSFHHKHTIYIQKKTLAENVVWGQKRYWRVKEPKVHFDTQPQADAVTQVWNVHKRSSVIDSKGLKCHNVYSDHALKSQMKMGVSKWNAWSFSSDMSDHWCAVLRASISHKLAT